MERLRSMKQIITAFVSIVLLVGCASAPSQSEIDSIDYGPEPSREQIEKSVKSLMGSYLKDPDSAKYEFSEVDPQRYYVKNTGIATDKKLYAGWRTIVRINAKNSYGGYTGFQYHQFLLRDGLVIGHNADANGWRLW